MSDITVKDTNTWKNEATNMWITHVKLSDGKVIAGENYKRIDAVFDARDKVKEYVDAVREKNAKAAEMPIAIDSDTGKRTISTDNPYIAGIGADILNTSLGSDAIQLQTLFAGLIEKAKREGLDGRLIAMANTDFERGFMVLEKAINTNKG